MASNTDLYHLIWSLQNPHLRGASPDPSLDHGTVSALCESHLETKLAEHRRLLEEQQRSLQQHLAARGLHGQAVVASLVSLCTAKIISLLEDSTDVLAEVRTLATYLNSSCIKAIVRDGRTPYRALRAFMGLPAGYGPAQAAETARAAVDIDEAILVSERYIRAKAAKRIDDRDLIGLEHARLTFDATHLDAQAERLLITRKDPPKGGLELFDVHRPRRLAIHRTDEVFIATFNRITQNILRGLDWTNVFVAGGIVLTTLLHTDPARDYEKRVLDGDIDMYLYGLTPHAANEKVKEIYRVWRGNLPALNEDPLVVKNAKTITFLADYPNRRVQVVLKLVPSPISVLLNFDLDPCAMGFNGREVLMLPRAARALETGYSTFTMDLVWGHHLQDRGAPQDPRVFKYADRGFGVRILPSYARCLEAVDPPRGQPKPQQGRGYPPFEACTRKPMGPEAGLKTLRRSSFVAASMIYAYYFPSFRDAMREGDGRLEDRWIRAMQELKKEKELNAARAREEGLPPRPYMELAPFTTNRLPGDLSGQRKAIGSFEVWMRHHEAWKLDAMEEGSLGRLGMPSDYGPPGYDDSPKYHWNQRLNLVSFAARIVRYNDTLFGDLRRAATARLNVDPDTGGWRDYLTRRIRRIVHGPDVDSVFAKQITIPLVIPYDLEEYIERLAREALSEAGLDVAGSQRSVLLPVHVPGQGTHTLPDLHDTVQAAGNVRYWVIGNEIMWAGIDRRIDEIFELLWALFSWLRYSEDGHFLDEPQAPLHLARIFYMRLPMPLKVPQPSAPIPENNLNGSDSNPSAAKASRTELLSEFDDYYDAIPRREAMRFQEWALRPAPFVRPDDFQEHRMTYDFMSRIYPPPDSLFWTDGDEGHFAPGNVPQWT